MKQAFLVTVLFALTPTLALAYQAKGSTGHMHPQLFHDRTPKAHVHGSQPHHSNVPVARS
jgi:hypothetical protein